MAQPALVLLVLALGPATQEERELAPWLEGPLENDAFLPLSPKAAQGFALAQAALAEARAASDRPRDAERAYERAFDGWKAALEAAEPGDLLGISGEADAGAPPRLAAAIPLALRARVAELSSEERALYLAHGSEGARSALLAAGADPQALARVAERFPYSEPAARAGLALADLCLAEGRLASAEAWLRRAAMEAPAPAISGALERRQNAIAALRPRRGPPAPALVGAQGLTPLGRVELTDPLFDEPRFDRPGERRGRGERPGGVRPGGAALADGRVAVQTPTRVHLLGASTAGQELAVQAVFDPSALVEEAFGRPPEALRASGATGWPLLPASDGRVLVLVQGRAARLDGRRGAPERIPNALLCVEPPGPPAGVLATRDLPVLRWAAQGNQVLLAGGSLVAFPELELLAGAEFQPGPVVLGDLVLVQARSGGAEANAWIVAYDLASGVPRYARFLAKGADLASEAGRFSGPPPDNRAAAPLLAVDERLFASTQLGTAHLLDALDGRMHFSLKIARRALSEPGWSGDRPLLAEGRAGPLVLCAPADSAFLYSIRLDAQAVLAPADLWDPDFPPLAIGDGEAPLGRSGSSLYVAGRPGARPAVLRAGPGGGERAAGLFLFRGERFGGPGLCDGGRLLVTSDRNLYLLDLERELYLVDRQPLTAPPGASHELVLAGNVAWVLAAGSAAAFRIER